MVNPTEDYDGNGVVDDGDKYICIYSSTDSAIYLWSVQIGTELYRFPFTNISAGGEIVIYNSAMDFVSLLTDSTIVLYTVGNVLMDSVTIGSVGTGMAYGRCPSASLYWTEIDPSPGLNNCP